jgi:hypothetical protein
MKTKVPGNKSLSVPSCLPQMTCTGMGSNSGLWVKWPVTQRLKIIFVRSTLIIFFYLSRLSSKWSRSFRNSNHVFVKETCPESKDTSLNFLCLLWQHCRRPWSFTCKSCLFDSGRTVFVWVRRVWNGSTAPKSRQMRGAFRHTISIQVGYIGPSAVQSGLRALAISICFFT